MPEITNGPQTIHYEVHGEGPPVLLAHSFLCSTAMWSPQIEGLKSSYTLIAVDARGHGKSGNATSPFTMYDSAKDHLAVLDALGIQRAAWAGLSMGGMSGMRAALAQPERIAGLMLLDTDGGPELPWVKTKYAVMAATARMLGLGALIPGVKPIMFGRTTLNMQPELVADWVGQWKKLHVPSMIQAIGAIKTRDDLRPRLGELACPALVLCGAEDKALPPARSKTLAEVIPASRYVEIPAAGHMAAQEQPQEVTRLMAHFLEELVAGELL